MDGGKFLFGAKVLHFLGSPSEAMDPFACSANSQATRHCKQMTRQAQNHWACLAVSLTARSFTCSSGKKRQMLFQPWFSHSGDPVCQEPGAVVSNIGFASPRLSSTPINIPTDCLVDRRHALLETC